MLIEVQLVLYMQIYTKEVSTYVAYTCFPTVKAVAVCYSKYLYVRLQAEVGCVGKLFRQVEWFNSLIAHKKI